MKSTDAALPQESLEELSPTDWAQPQFILVMALSIGLLATVASYGMPMALLEHLSVTSFAALALAASLTIAVLVCALVQAIRHHHAQPKSLQFSAKDGASNTIDVSDLLSYDSTDGGDRGGQRVTEKAA